jgi:hypothetical protein
LEIDDSVAHSGSRSLKVVGIIATGTARNCTARYSLMPAENDRRFTIAFWAKVDAQEGQSREITIYGQMGYEFSEFYRKPIILDSTDWKEYTDTFVVPSGPTNEIWIGLSVAQSDVDFWIDDFRFFEGEPADEVKEPAGVKGDVNGDGKLRSDDAIMALRIAAGLTVPTDDQLWAADVNDDGRIISNDVIFILRKVAGLETPI